MIDALFRLLELEIKSLRIHIHSTHGKHQTVFCISLYSVAFFLIDVSTRNEIKKGYIVRPNVHIYLMQSLRNAGKLFFEKSKIVLLLLCSILFIIVCIYLSFILIKIIKTCTMFYVINCVDGYN